LLSVDIPRRWEALVYAMRTTTSRQVKGLATPATAELPRADPRHVVMQTPALICVTVGRDHIVDTVNRLFQQALDQRDITGLSLREAFPHWPEERLAALDRAYDSGEPVTFKEITDTVTTAAGDEQRFFTVVVQPLKNDADVVYGLLRHAVDVTDQVRAQQEQADLALALERSNRELDSFAYAASHDLRAPLRGIGNLAQWIEEDLLANGQLKGDTREMLDLMRLRMHRMEGLIEGLLQYSRAGRTHQEPELVDVGHLVQEVVDLLSPPERATIRIATDLPTMRTERLLLQQVFMNLIGNAIKHANRDDPSVTIDARRVGPFYEFSVRDNGPGIAPDFHERIWGIFQTLESRDRVEGAGIGLALVKKIVESQKGRAWVESAPGLGATFRFLWRKS
jgi:signal transduction histidine kinase